MTKFPSQVGVLENVAPKI